MAKLTLDIESYSEENLKTAGLYRYAEHPSTDLMCVCWAFDDGPVSAWVPTADTEFLHSLVPMHNWGALYLGPQVPSELRTHIESGGEVHAWNAAFERTVLNGVAGQRYGFPKISIEQTRCSMARARACSLPGALEDAADALETPVRKNTAGLNAMRYLCKPRTDGSRPTLADERDRYLKLVPYCGDDVRAERGVDDRLPELSPKEIRVYHLDQRINDRGVKADMASVANFEALIKQYKDHLFARCKELTGLSPSAPGPLANWIRTTGKFPSLENLQAETVRQALAQPGIPETVATVLKLFSTYNMKAVSKFPAIRKAVCKDGRLHGMFGYHAASTGRWASYIVQLHNIYRGVPGLDKDAAIEAAALQDLGMMRMLFKGIDPMKVFASCVRGMLIADEGNELVYPDLSGVEARETAWMFGEQWKLNLWAAGGDNYIEAYCRTFGLAPGTEISKRQRLIGKVLELSMQYGGGVGAFIKMCRTYGLDVEELKAAWPGLPEDVRVEAEQNHDYAKLQGRTYDLPKDVWLVCEGMKVAWRRAHPGIVRGWKNLQDAAKMAIQSPGQVYWAVRNKLGFKVEKEFLIMRLPSGRRVYYFKPEIRGDEIRYTGVDTETRQWQRTSTYGGKLCENQAQAVCRDLLVDAMLRFDAAGWNLTMHVHDEPVVEAPAGKLTDAEVERLMCQTEAWSEGFPIEIEGHRGQRYSKE